MDLTVVLGVGGDGLGEGRLDVDQLGADDGGAELGVWSLSFRLGPSCLICLRLRPVERNWVGSDQHCPLSPLLSLLALVRDC